MVAVRWRMRVGVRLNFLILCVVVRVGLDLVLILYGVLRFVFRVVVLRLIVNWGLVFGLVLIRCGLCWRWWVLGVCWRFELGLVFVGG